MQKRPDSVEEKSFEPKTLKTVIVLIEVLSKTFRLDSKSRCVRYIPYSKHFNKSRANAQQAWRKILLKIKPPYLCAQGTTLNRIL